MTDHKFQIDLRGIIDLLSNHLYSGPQVFVRELLQNATDAIRARRKVEAGHTGSVTIEVLPRTLMVEDDGIGLDEEEVHRFLATIGASSKRDLEERRTDFIGQFGIGILSCFVVSDEIVLITRALRGGKTLEWKGRPDGTYTVRALEQDLPVGTRVFLRCKPGCEELFEPERIVEMARKVGGLLPFPIKLVQGESVRVLNDEVAPWEAPRGEVLAAGERAFGMSFFDSIPLRSGPGEVVGVAYVLPYPASLAKKTTHRVYLKRMLLTESGEELLPGWAFFVKCIVNADALRPTASRESFYEDETLEETREALGACLRGWLVELARRDPDRLQRLVRLHHLAIKALAVADDEFFRIFIDWLPFETSLGLMTLGEFRAKHDVVRFARTVDQFRQIARVAAAQQLGVVNAGYTHDAELIEKLPSVFPELTVEEVEATDLTQKFSELSTKEQDALASFLDAASAALEPFRCAAAIRRFQPPELPALYATSADATFRRSVELSREVADPHWSSLLDSLSPRSTEPEAELCFNWESPLVQKIARISDAALLKLSVQMLYVQALLLGHHPLRAKEMALLNQGLLGLIDWSASRG